MSFSQIPTALLNNPDRNAAFQGIRAWMQDEMSSPQVSVEDAISTGAKTIDIALGGGYIPGRMTEIVEPQPSRGAQSLIHHTIIQARKIFNMWHSLMRPINLIHSRKVLSIFKACYGSAPQKQLMSSRHAIF